MYDWFLQRLSRITCVCSSASVQGGQKRDRRQTRKGKSGKGRWCGKNREGMRGPEDLFFPYYATLRNTQRTLLILRPLKTKRETTYFLFPLDCLKSVCFLFFFLDEFNCLTFLLSFLLTLYPARNSWNLSPLLRGVYFILQIRLLLRLIQLFGVVNRVVVTLGSTFHDAFGGPVWNPRCVNVYASRRRFPKTKDMSHPETSS